MSLDLRSIMLFASVLALLQASVTLLFSVAGKKYPGIYLWALGNSLLAIGLLQISLRSLISDLASIVGANTLIALGISLLLHGCLRFTNRPVRLWRMYWPIGLIAVLFAYFTYVFNSVESRIIIISLFVSLRSFQATNSLLVQAPERSWASYRFTGITFVVLGTTFLLRGLIIWLFQPRINVFAPSSLQTTYFLITCLTIVLLTSGFGTMVMQRLVAELRQSATTDFLTGTLNRRAALQRLQAEVARYRRTGIPFSILLLDIDHFKAINDLHGHQAGDVVLVQLARILANQLRSDDMLCRWGGEEFLIMLSAQNANTAQQAAERLRQRVMQEVYHVNAHIVRCTASIGVTAIGHRKQELDAVIAGADQALYQAKQAGRNRVEIFPTPAHGSCVCK